MTPSPSQPGSELGQLTILDVYLKIPPDYRRRFPGPAWRSAREAVLAHARKPAAADIEQLVDAILREPN